MNKTYKVWEERFRTKVDEKQYWESVIKVLLEDEEIDKNSAQCLLEFVGCKEAEFLFEKEILPQEEIQKRILNLLENFTALEKRREEGEKYINKFPGAEEYYELKKKYGGNEEPYKADFYQKEKMYIVFYYMLAEKQKTINAEFEKKICYKRYGKITAYGNYYNESAICDLVISNISRGALYKRTPKSLSDKAEYKYGEDGALLVFKWYDKDEKEYFKKIYFQLEKAIYSFKYERSGRLEEIGIRKYENGKIIHSEYGRLWEEKRILCNEIHSEKYRYFDNELCEAFLEEYTFPMRSERSGDQWAGFLKRHQYIFESDDQGYLKGYVSKEWWGDKIKETIWGDRMFEIREKVRKDTGKDAGRWQRPNYFIE